jgi:hypothetical protein
MNRAAPSPCSRVGRQAAEQGRQGKDAQTGQVDRLGAIPVGQRSCHQQQRRESEGVAVHDPDQIRQGNGELHCDAGQGDVDDGDVQHRHDEADGQRD